MDLPALSNTAVDFAAVETKDLFQKDPPLSTELLLQNEFFKIRIDEKSGGIRSIQQHSAKTNLAGQQLSIRLPKKHPGKQQYADMVADSVKTIENETLSAAIKSTGRLLAGDLELARFEQTVRIVRGISRIEINVTLDPLDPLTANSNHYICSRLAWKSESARLFANVLDSREQVASPWFHATKFVTVQDSGSTPVSLLTGGLPYHRRANRRMLDSLLMLHNESQTSFSFAIDVDQAYPSASAASRLTLPSFNTRHHSKGRPQKTNQKRVNTFKRNPTGCFISIARISLQPPRHLFSTTTASCNGVSLRLKETEARVAQLTITSLSHCKPPKS